MLMQFIPDKNSRSKRLSNKEIMNELSFKSVGNITEEAKIKLDKIKNRYNNINNFPMNSIGLAVAGYYKELNKREEDLI